MQAEFAGAQTAIKAATDRQTQLKGMAQTMLNSIEGINQDEVATKILALRSPACRPRIKRRRCCTRPH